jgi:hopanoid C-2 methylase
MTVNILYALPHTPLYDRLLKANRILGDAAGHDSNIEFLRPYEDVVSDWKKVIGHVFSPEQLYARYQYNVEHTYPHRLGPTKPWKQATPRNLARAFSILRRIIWRIGVQSNYRKHFWKMAIAQFKEGKIENIFQIAMVAHHLIVYAQECVQGVMQSSNYSARPVEKAVAVH